MYVVNPETNELETKESFIPFVEEWETEKCKKDQRISRAELSMSSLKAPFVFNQIKFNNEDKYSTLYNSDNC